MGLPEHPVNTSWLPLEINNTHPITCGELALYASLQWTSDALECRLSQDLAVADCQCPPPSCVLCPDEGSPPYPNNTVPITPPMIASLGVGGPGNMTCSEYERLLEGVVNEDDCSFFQSSQYLCGCNHGERDYFGLDTEQKRAAFVWGPRVSGIISILSSSLIVVDIVRHQKTMSVYQQILLGMAGADILSSVGWAFSAAALPPILRDGYPNGYYGARGTQATCTAQGVLIQLSLMSAFYNGSLSFYYLLSIYYGLRESRLHLLQWRFHVPPVILGLAVAFGGIPFYGPTHFACMISAPPFQPTLAPLLSLFIIPLLLTLAIATINMVLVYTKVRRTRVQGDRWRSQTAHLSLEMSVSDESMDLGSQHHRSSLRENRTTRIAKQEREVFWQGLTYLLALYITWMFLVAASLTHLQRVYWLTPVAIALAPMQGFWNAIVYFRVTIRLIHMVPAWSCSRADQTVESSKDSSDPAERASKSLNKEAMKPASSMDQEKAF